MSRAPKISSHNNQDISSLLIVNTYPFVSEKENSMDVQNSLMRDKILVDTSFLEELNKLREDYESEKRITKYMESS